MADPIRVVDLSAATGRAAQEAYSAIWAMARLRRRIEKLHQRLAKEQEAYCQAEAAAIDALRTLATAPVQLPQPDRVIAETLH
jgi:hypothetical protein